MSHLCQSPAVKQLEKLRTSIQYSKTLLRNKSPNSPLDDYQPHVDTQTKKKSVGMVPFRAKKITLAGG